MLESGPEIPVVTVSGDVDTVGKMFRERCTRSGSRPAIYEKRRGEWAKTTWADFYDHAARVAGGLVDLGIEPGDRVAILGPTQPPWCYYDMGAQLTGLVSFGIYPKQSVEQIRYLLINSDAKAVIVDGDQEIEHVLEAADGIETLEVIVPWTHEAFEKFTERDARLRPPDVFSDHRLSDEEIDQRLATRGPDDVAIFVYTSGTTGPPKGAMIGNNNIISLLRENADTIDFLQSDMSLSFLPMAHSAERILAFFGRIDSGLPTAYASAISKVLDEVAEVQPTLFGSVPRIFEKAYAKIQTGVEQKPAPVQKLFRWAEGVGRRRIRLILAGEPVPTLLELQYSIADRLVFSKIRDAFGGRVRQFITGAAPIAIEILEFFWAAGLPIYECYGMTEATVITHANREGEVKLGTVGRKVGSVECRIADDGEILIKGDWVFLGYWKNEEATANTVIDEWLHTGDIGEIDADGYLKITDRKKHLIITAGGKNLAPANIENALKNTDPLISQVHAHGDRRPYVSAIVAPSPIETLEWGRERGLVSDAEVEARTAELMENPQSRSDELNRAVGKVVAHNEYKRRIQHAVNVGNRDLANVEKVKRFIILDRDFSQEHGELTPTMKVKRKALEEKFAETFDRIYDDPDFALEPRG